MKFNIIASGSKGNATIIKYKDSILLIDMGITLTRLQEGLKEWDLKLDQLSGALFTHDHGDHIRGLRFISPKICYSTRGTLTSLCNEIDFYQPFLVGEFKITPYKTSHDATNPCCYLIEAGEEKLAYVTDTGYMLEETINAFKNVNYLIIESNHDIQMLLKTNRPLELKERIMSDHGHLCNEDSAVAAANIVGPDTKEIVLAHLSEEANTPELAISAYEKIFHYFGKDVHQYILKCANQNHSVQGGNLDED